MTLSMCTLAQSRATVKDYSISVKKAQSKVEACMANFAADYSQMACTLVEITSSKDYVLIKGRDSVHDLGVKLSPCICSHNSCPD